MYVSALKGVGTDLQVQTPFEGLARYIFATPHFRRICELLRGHAHFHGRYGVGAGNAPRLQLTRQGRQDRPTKLRHAQCVR